MIDGALLFIAIGFVIGGLVKGVVGLGMPTVALGVMAIVLPPVQAAAVLILPSVCTNIWQMLAGPYLLSNVRRLWPFLAGLVAGTLYGRGWLTGAYVDSARLGLGIMLVLYGISGFFTLRFNVPRHREWWLGPTIGLASGLINAATAMFVIPAVPYMQAIELKRDELVQALGLVFITSSLAMTVNLMAASALTAADWPRYAVALAAAVLGMGIGMAVRDRLSPQVFRHIFFGSLIVLGAQLVWRVAA